MGFFAARQEILNRENELFGYELLFRASLDNAFPDIDHEKATSRMIEGLHFDLGVDEIADGKLAFINFTQDTLLKGYPELLSGSQIVIEILETVQPTDEVLATVKSLHAQGYKIALDDFVHGADWFRFYPYIDIVKIDMQEASHEEILDTIRHIRLFKNIKLLAEKVETKEDYEIAVALDFDLYQGYYFSRPEIMQELAKEMSNPALMELMTQLAKRDFDVDNIVQKFEVDVALSFQLLKHTEATFDTKNNKVESLKQAVLLLGRDELSNFVNQLVKMHRLDAQKKGNWHLSLAK